MIPGAAITAWATSRPWRSRVAIEHDLLMARLIVAVYNHPLLSTNFALRGAACLHQVHMPAPRRFSPDLDFVCPANTDITVLGTFLDALREIGEQIGLRVPPRRWRLNPESIGAQWHVDVHPRMRLRAQPEEDPAQQICIKAEINNRVENPVRPMIRLPFTVDSPWFAGTAQVLTYATPEVVATKVHALYNRAKGRDLFDLWLALTEMAVDPDEILACLVPYWPEGVTAAAAVANLEAKLSDANYRTDHESLVGSWPDGFGVGYDVDAAGALVKRRLLSRM